VIVDRRKWFSIFFLSLALLLGVVKFVLGVGSMLCHGINVSASPSIWIVIPVLTLFGITAIRLTMGLHHGFDEPVSQPGLLVLTSAIFSLQILFGLIGYMVMNPGAVGIPQAHSLPTMSN